MKKRVRKPPQHLIYILFVVFGLLMSFKGSAQNTQLTLSNVIINSCEGSITIFADGGDRSEPYNYVWSKKNALGGWDEVGGNYFVLDGQAPGTYRFVVTDANGDEVSGEYVISPPGVLYVNEILTGLVCPQDPTSGVIILRFDNGLPPYTWTLTGSGFTTRAGTVTPTSTPYYLSLDGIPVGDYTFDWTDDFGCSGTEEITVSIPPITELTINTTTDVVCFGDTNGEINISVTGGWGPNYAINIVPDGEAPQSIGDFTNIGDGTSYTINNLAAGTYQIYYYDKLANPPLTTTYGLDVSDYNCAKSETFTIDTPAELISTPTGELLSCFGNTDGNITGTITGGTAPYDIILDGTTTRFTGIPEGGSFDFSELSAGTYNFTITDAANCDITVQASITEPDELTTAFVSKQNVSCNAGTDGNIIVSVTGGTAAYIFSVNGTEVAPISSSGANYTIGNLSTGTYSISVTDQNNCTATAVIKQTITEPTPLAVAVSGDTLACFGDSDGTITGNISGGTAPYRIILDETGVQFTGITDGGTFDFSGLSAGTYNFTITDSANCTTTVQEIINTPAELISTPIGELLSCFGDTDGNITGTITGGTAPYSITLEETGAQFTGIADGGTFDFSGLSEGTYNFTITDAAGCLDTAQAAITQPDELITAFVSKQDVSCNAGDDGNIIVSVTGGTAPYIFKVDGTEVTPTLINETNYTIGDLGAGSYTITITDQNTCTATNSITRTITEPDEIILSLVSFQNLSCFNSGNGSITVSATGGTPSTTLGVPNYVFTLTGPSDVIAQDNGNGTWTFASLDAGTYTISVTDQNNCSSNPAQISQEITQPLAVSFTGLEQDISCNGAADGSIDITEMQGGTTPYTYSWTGPNSFSATTQDISALAPGDYTITITDDNGCVVEETYTIKEPDVLGLTEDLSDYNGFGVSGNGEDDGSIDITVTGGVTETPYTYSWTSPDREIPDGQEAQEDLSTLNAGTYTVQITDANGCTITDTWTITEPNELLISEQTASRVDVLCFGENTGVIEVVVTQQSVAPYNYAITNSLEFEVEQVTDSSPNYVFDELLADTYTVTVTDANGISKSINITITQPANLLEISAFSILDYNGYGISCKGANDGSIDITVTGGEEAYTYSWTGPNSFSAITQDISPLAPGAYTITVTDDNGCVVEETYTISEPELLTLGGFLLSDYTGFGVSGNGESDGSIDITVIGGTMPYTYSWTSTDGTIPTGQETEENLTDLNAGTYTVLITDANGCTITDTWTITEPQELLISEEIASHVDVLCFGENTGVIEVVVDQESVGPYQYTITNSSNETTEVTNQTTSYVFDELFADTYTVTVTDANGISKSINITITEPAAILNIDSVVLSSHNGFNISCNGAADGSIDLTVSGGTAGYTYVWSGLSSFNETTQDISALEPGEYTITVTDANGCTVVETYTITEPDVLDLTGELSDYNGFGVSGNGEDDGSIDFDVIGGTMPYTYSWTSPDGTIPTGQETEENLTDLNAGTYTVLITDANGCTITDTWTITEPQELLISEEIASHVDVLCFGENTGVIEVVVDQESVGPYEYTITNSSGIEVERVTNQTTSYVFDGLLADMYTVRVTDANEISKSINITINQPANLLEISAFSILDYNGFGISCNGAADGSIDITVTGGEEAYKYSWSGPNSFSETTQNISALEPGDYTITVTDANGCSTSPETYTITEPDEIIINTTLLQNVQCFENSDGKIEITITGGTGDFTYDWTKNSIPYATTKDITGLAPGEYVLIVQEEENDKCFRTKTFIITQPDLLEIAFESKIDILCFGDTTGSVQVSVTGGTSPYQYSWIEASGATYNTEDVSGVPAGDYQLTVNDALGCSATFNVILSEPDNIVLNESKTDITCYGSNDGTISLDVTGGVSPYTYVWSDLGNGPLRSDLSPGIYDVTVTDSNNCQKNLQLEIIEAPIFKIEPITTHISCFGAVDGSIELNLTGGVAPLSITWADDTSAGLTRNNLSAGSYSVFIEDALGCSIAKNFSIIEPNKIVLDAVVTNAIDCTDPNSGRIDLQVVGGTAPFTFLWSNGATSEDLQNIGANNYTVTVTDSRGCEEQKTFVITRQASLVLNLNTSIIPECINQTVIQRNELEVTGGVAPYAISWSNGTASGANGEIMETAQNGTVIAEVTDSLGCTEQLVFDVNLFTLGDPSFNYDSFASANYGILSIDDPITFINTSSGDPLNFLWSFGDGNTSTDKDPTHTYTAEGTYEVILTVQYPYGCSYQDTITMNIGKGYDIVIPNAFTPNNDGLNDVIRPVYIGMIDVEMSIYSTWGGLIYFEKGLELNGWDGEIKNSLGENGNYIIKVKATTFYGLVVSFNRPITLIK